jgi:ABC-2 type transport system permease protein
MSKAGIVARHEFVSTLKRRSALFVMFGLPLLSVLFLAGINWLVNSQSGLDSNATDAGGRDAVADFVFGNDEKEGLPIGLVDETGQIDASEPTLADGTFTLFPDREAALVAYEAGDVRGYYVVPADYLQNGRIFYYADSFPFTSWQRQRLYVLLATTFLGDSAPVARIVDPLQGYREVNVSAGRPREETTSAGNFALGIGIAILFYLTATGAAGYLLQSLGKEKQNRVMEILLSSVRPFELMLGKMVGLGGIGILQMVIWGVVAWLVLRPDNNALASLPLPTLSITVWLVVFLYFIVGYLVYASLFAGLGAVTPSPKESAQYTFALMLPVFLPMWFNTIMIASPNGTFATVLSLIPLTAPVAMPMRLAVTAVPLWQWLAGLALSLLTAAGTLWLATKLFRSRTLLSGQSPSWRGIWQALRDA